ncbi:MAG: DUF2201 family putative metallopeptidase [Bradymonadia bacterium]
MADPELEREISSSMLYLRANSPFFATLCLFARLRPTERIPTAATDGKDIFYNPTWLRTLLPIPAKMRGLLIHEVLHAALLHVQRRGNRDPVRWNIAADVVVNGIIDAERDRILAASNRVEIDLPDGAIREPKLAHLQVEEIYELLDDDKHQNCPQDLLGDGADGGDLDGLSVDGLKEAEAIWRAALNQASTIARQAGKMPGGASREMATASAPQVDWKAALWRYLVQTPNDFSGYDRRFFSRGLYIDALEGQSLKVFIGVDTSGSIGGKMLGAFLGEVEGILSSYPHIKAMLYYVDFECHGPYELGKGDEPPEPKGGGGTSFVPFFDAIEKEGLEDPFGQSVSVYLTDGYGDFPQEKPPIDTLWVVTPGGLQDEEFPFGEVVRLYGVEEY